MPPIHSRNVPYVHVCTLLVRQKRHKTVFAEIPKCCKPITPL